MMASPAAPMAAARPRHYAPAGLDWANGVGVPAFAAAGC